MCFSNTLVRRQQKAEDDSKLITVNNMNVRNSCRGEVNTTPRRTANAMGHGTCMHYTSIYSKVKQMDTIKEVHIFYILKRVQGCQNDKTSQITKFMGPTRGPPGSCRPQMGPMLAPWTLLSGLLPKNCSEARLFAFCFTVAESILLRPCITPTIWHCFNESCTPIAKSFATPPCLGSNIRPRCGMGKYCIVTIQCLTTSMGS